ncbi:MAG: GIY-YIG nuclease family protein [Sphaerochaetaceae bacterium]
MDKKQLRLAYEQMKPPMGVFLVTDKRTSQNYLGISKNFQTTKNSLFFRLSIGALGNYPELQRHYTQAGEAAIEFSIVEELEYQEEREAYEEELEILLSLQKQAYRDAKEIRL